jgi:hypothetical protein
MRIKQSTAFLVDSSGRVVGYVDENGRERDMSGAFITPGITPTKASYLLDQSGAPSTVTGTTNETTLATVTVPAGAVLARGALRITSLWSMTNNANVKTLLARLAGVNIGGGVGTSSVATFFGQQVIWNRSATNSQVMRPAVATSFGTSTSAVLTAAVDMTAAQNLTFTGTLANAADSITLEAYTVEVLNP